MGEDRAVALYRHPFAEGGAGSRDLLALAARRHTGLPLSHFREIVCNPWGKPAFVREPHLHFSVSHSGGWWLCAFSPQPVGLDLQLHRAQADLARLSRRFFHPLEDRWLAREGYARFFELWSAKESWVKYLGRGFYLDPGEFSLVSPQGRFPVSPLGEGTARFLPLPFQEGYSLWLCARQIQRVEALPL